MLFNKKNTASAEETNNKESVGFGGHRDAVSPAERAMIASASGDTAKANADSTAKIHSAKYDYLNAPIVKSRPCPLCGEQLEADTIFCPKCNNRVVSRYDEALILRRQGKELPKAETKPAPAPVKAEPPKAEAKPAPVPVKTEPPKSEAKPAPAPVKAEPPKSETKPAPKKGGLAAFTDPETPDSLVIKVTGSGYTKHTMNPHFKPADDFDD